MLSTPLAVFGEPFVASGHQIDVCADGKLVTIGGLSVVSRLPLRAAREADVVILPGWRNADEAVSKNIVSELASAHRRGAIVVGLCLGAFGLAQAKLLDVRRATTHWACAAAFASRYPEITVDSDALYVDEGHVLTSAGIASGLDCCLHLLARISGIEEANRVARHLVVAPQRAGAQPQLLERPSIGTSADKRTTEILETLRTAPFPQPSLDELAARAGMSRRSLSRHIRARTGGSLGQWIKQIRLAKALELLAANASGIEDIASRAGFPDAHALRSAFRAEFGLTPTQWLSRQRLIAPPRPT